MPSHLQGSPHFQAHPSVQHISEKLGWAWGCGYLRGRVKHGVKVIVAGQFGGGGGGGRGA